MSLSLGPEKGTHRQKGKIVSFRGVIFSFFEVFSTCLANNEDVTTSEGGRNRSGHLYTSLHAITREKKKPVGARRKKK